MSDDFSMLDHRLIEVTVKSVIPYVVWFRNPRKANWMECRKSVKKRLTKCIDTCIGAAMISSFEENCPIAQKITGRVKLKWSAKLESRRKETKRLLNGARKKDSKEAWNKYKSNQAIYKNLIQEVKKESWKKWCSDISTVRVSPSSLSRSIGGELKFIKRNNGSFTRTSEKNVHLLFETNFPDFKSGEEHQSL